MAYIEIKNLSFSYPNSNKNILDNINISIEKGEFIVLCGKSGSGKSTFLRHLKPQLTPYGTRNGEIFIDNTNVLEMTTYDQAKKIGFVMQNPDEQIVTDKVWHEMAFGLENIGCDKSTMRLRVAEMASFFGIEAWFDRDTATLSGGQKQLLNLASIMAMQPEIIILDEPTSQLDPIAAADFLNSVRKINLELGTTIIITEHRLEDVYHYADSVICMENGKIIEYASPEIVGLNLFKNNNPLFYALPTPIRVFYTLKNSGKSPITVRDGRNWLYKEFRDDKIKYKSISDEKKSDYQKKLAIAISEGWFRYEKNERDILKGLNLEVPKGSIYTILGGNGTGKSTTLKVCSGICSLYRGKVKIFGKNINKYKNNELFKDCLALLPQDPTNLFSMDTVAKDLAEMTSDLDKINSIAKLCDISHLMTAHPRDLSGGEQQRVALAKVLLTKPSLLMLDEPTKGLDNFFKIKLAGILKKLQNNGVTILIVSHDIEFCAEYSDLISLFFNGNIVTTATPRLFFSSNSFYTTAAKRMSNSVFDNSITVKDIVQLYEKNKENKL